MLRAVVVLCCVAGCVGGSPRAYWRDVEPSSIAPRERVTVFVIARDYAAVVDGVVAAGTLHGTPVKAWRVDPNQRITIRDEETPASTAERHGWRPAPPVEDVAIPLGDIRHASTEHYDVVKKSAFLVGSIGLLIGVLLLAGIVGS